MALVGIELETLVYEPDALTTRPLPCAIISILFRNFTPSITIRLFYGEYPS